MEKVTIDGIEYVRKDSVTEKAVDVDVEGKEYCIVRTYSAGVFAGYIGERNGKQATLLKSRGIWYWAGACGLSQLAVDGTAEPEKCKFTVEVDVREVTEVVEIIPCTKKAFNSIQGVKVWKK